MVPPAPRHLIAIPLLVAAAASAGTGRAAETLAPLKVAAAADLEPAFKEIGELFRARTGRPVVFSFGSTGLLAKQILEGAPFDLFAAANVSFVDEVIAAKAGVADTRQLYARGQLAIWWRHDSGSAPPVSLADLASPRFRKVAIANPEHAPYGRAAKEALTTTGIWEAVRPKLVYGENVRQAMQFAATGNADVAVAALSLAQATPDGALLLVDPRLYAPLDQALVLCNRSANPAAGRLFIDTVLGAEGQAIMRRHGFNPPLGQPPAPLPSAAP
jgi:molybdate transport system substrate-binding protein